MALVWLAGPLAGVVGQPLFGLSSDQSRMSWGKRRPFIAGGAVFMILSLLGLAWVKEIVYMSSWILWGSMDRDALQTATLTAAAIFVWILNFAIQPLQGGLRALIVDCNPPEQMDVANAWASRMVSAGSLIGYGSGFFDLPRLMYGAGGSKFQRLSVFAVLGLAFAVCLCCLFIQEQDPNEDGPPSRELRSTMGKLRHICKAMVNLHPSMIQVFKVQFCSWIGWFSFLYYISTYISEICMSMWSPFNILTLK